MVSALRLDRLDRLEGAQTQHRIPPSSPETYVSSHLKSHTNTIILREQATDAQYAALRVFFDCLYATCGYIPWYYRKEFGIINPDVSNDISVGAKGSEKSWNESDRPHEESHEPNSPAIDSSVDLSTDSSSSKPESIVTIQMDEELDTEPNSGDVPTPDKDEWKHGRYKAVIHQLREEGMGQVTEDDIKWLVGQHSEYNNLHTSHHSMSVKLVAVQLERITRDFGRRRKRAILKAFRWLTGQSSYAVAYEHPEESRRFTDRGIKGPPILFDDSDKDEPENENDEI